YDFEMESGFDGGNLALKEMQSYLAPLLISEGGDGETPPPRMKGHLPYTILIPEIESQMKFADGDGLALTGHKGKTFYIPSLVQSTSISEYAEFFRKLNFS